MTYAAGVSVERRLLYLMQHATRAAIAHASASTSEAAGVTIPQLGALSHLAAEPGATPTDVAIALGLNKSGTSSLVARLEKSGFLRREPNPRDARGVRLFLTKKGEAAREKARPAFRRAVAEFERGFAASEMETVFRFLNELVDRFGRASSQEEEA